MGRVSRAERHATVVAELRRVASEAPPLLQEHAAPRPVSDAELDVIRRGAAGCWSSGLIVVAVVLPAVLVVGIAAVGGIREFGVATGLLLTVVALGVVVGIGRLASSPLRSARRAGPQIVAGLDRPVTAAPVLYAIWTPGSRDARVRVHLVTFAVDEGATAFLTAPIASGSLRAKAWSSTNWWLVGADRGWVVGEIGAGSAVAFIDRYGGIAMGGTGEVETPDPAAPPTPPA